MSVDCPTQLTLISFLWYLYFMTNIKVTNMKNTAGKSAGARLRKTLGYEGFCSVAGLPGARAVYSKGRSHHRSLYTGLFLPPRALLSTRDPAGCKMQIWNKPRTWRQTSHLFYNSSCVSSENLGGGGLMPVSRELPTGRCECHLCYHWPVSSPDVQSWQTCSFLTRYFPNSKHDMS